MRITTNKKSLGVILFILLLASITACSSQERAPDDKEEKEILV